MSLKTKKRHLATFTALLIIIILTPLAFYLTRTPQEVGAAWYSGGSGIWQFRKRVIIDSTKVSGSSDFTDFHIVINRNFPELSDHAQTDGDDILFTLQDGTTKISHEIEFFDKTSGELIVWLELPTLYATTDTSFYMYYGNLTTGSNQDVANMWGGNFSAVWHFNEDPTIGSGYTILDSTTNNADGDPTGAARVRSKVGYGLSFNGSTDWMTVDDSDTDSLDLGTSDFTFMLWHRFDGDVSGTSNGEWLIGKSDGGPSNDTNRGYIISYREDWLPDHYGLRLSDGNDGDPGVPAWQDNLLTSSASWDNPPTWNHITLRVDRDANAYYVVNGVQQGALTDHATANNSLDVTQDLVFCTLPYNPGWSPFECGTFDEFWILKENVSEDFAITAYTNQNDASFFKSYGDYDMYHDPISYWKFDEGSGTDAFDSTSSQNHGTISGASWQTASSCIFGPCLLFDGSNDVVTIANNDTLDFDKGLKTGASVSFWVNPSSDGEGDTGRIFTKGSHLFCRTDSESGGKADLECTIDLATTDATVNVSSGLTIGAWHHVEITYGDDGDDDLLVYINGELKGTGNGSGAPVGTDTSSLLIGGDTGTNYHGYIDDFKVFAYERTADQVKTDYLKGASDAGSNIAVGIGGTAMPDPTVWWRFDETNGTTANDATGNSNSGTITSGTWTLNGKIASALVFTASTSVSDTITDPAYTNTISLWVYPTTSVASKTLVTSGKLTTNASSQPVYGGCTGTTLPLTTWTHIVAVSSGSGSCSLYQNGIQTSTAGTGVTFGTSLNVGGSSFVGTIDDVKLYNTALTSDQVKVDYNATSALNAGTGVNERSLHASGDSYMDNLYAYWSFDENTGTGDPLIDSSGLDHGAKVTDSNPIWIPGIYGSAIDFNNTSQIEKGDTNLFKPGYSDFTYMAWFYLDSQTPSSTRYLFSKQSTVEYGYATAWNPSTNMLSSGIRLNYSSMQTSVDISSYINKWAHYAFVYDRDDMLSVYINGVLSDAGSISSFSSRNLNASATFNVAFSGGGGRIYGKIDEFKFFMSALTPAQIAYEYNRGAPLAWYRMDECQGTVINDASGNGFTGTLTIGGSGTYTSAGTCGSGTSTHAWNAGTTGKMNSAMAFDGTNDYVSVSDASNIRFDSGSQDFSLFAWVKRGTSGATHYIVSKEDADNDGYRLQFDSGNTVTCSVDAVDITSTATITDTNWHHVGCVVDRDGNGRVYIDGLPNGSAVAISSEVMATTTALRLGSRSYTATSYLDGLLDDVRLYNYALSEAQVKSVMTGGVARFE